jgi:hypothetical protein
VKERFMPMLAVNWLQTESSPPVCSPTMYCIRYGCQNPGTLPLRIASGFHLECKSLPQCRYQAEDQKFCRSKDDFGWRRSIDLSKNQNEEEREKREAERPNNIRVRVKREKNCTLDIVTESGMFSPPCVSPC